VEGQGPSILKGESVRYRRLSYRYAEFIRTLGPRPLGDPWGSRLPIPFARPQWRPPVDLYETAEGLSIKVEVAGMSEEDFDVTLYDDTLVVEGMRPWELSAGEARFYAVEVRYGPFMLEVPLPFDVDRDRVQARYERGFLYLTLPKAGGVQP
jgi:HSP20 family protein